MMQNFAFVIRNSRIRVSWQLKPTLARPKRSQRFPFSSIEGR
jgi:hypothetical protein